MNLEKTKKVLGLNSVLKGIHNSKIKEVLLANNCPKETEDKINNISNINDIPVKKLDEDSNTLGIMCKKTFNVSVLGILKE